MGKIFRVLLGLVVLLAIFYFFKTPILRSTGNVLIHEDSLKKAPVMFILGGGAFDRGAEGAKVYKAGYAPKIICTSQMIPSDIKALGLSVTEAELTQKRCVSLGVPPASVEALNKATSTKEESDVILGYCKLNGINKCIIISAKFHTSRIKKAFKKKFEDNNIEVIIHGAPASEYKEDLWWEDEQGMIMVNNEYIKHLYYFIKY